MSFPFTPPRPVPGTYFQTPAAAATNARRPLFHQKPLSPPIDNTTSPNLPSTAAPRPSSPETITPRERAARTIDETLLRESRYPDLDSYLSQGFSSEYQIPSSPSWAPFQKAKMYKIPDQIFDQYNRAQVSTSMGLFAELNHAWVTIDNALYLWDYTSPNPQLLGFEDQPNSINTVKIVRPRKGVFLSAITHLLVVATTADVLLLGLGYETNGDQKTLNLFQTGMSVPIRGLDVSVITSSDSAGRIFFAGSTDNDVHELTYQQEERWFQGRCAKINHTSTSFAPFAPSFNFGQKATEHVEQMVVDDTRNLLYTLSSNSSIRVFYLKQDGGLNLTITKHAADIYSNIGHVISSNDALNPKVKIVSISPITAPEASRYHLMAITATGYRIYLSATSSYHWAGTGGAPTSMQAQHVKTPPSDPASDRPSQAPITSIASYQTPPTAAPIHSLNPTSSAERFPPGYFFCITQKDPSRQTDLLFVSTPDCGVLARPQDPSIPIKPVESGIWIPLNSRVEAIGVSAAYAGGSQTRDGFGNELSVQFDKPATEVAILTNTGVHVIRRRRLVDMLASLIRNPDGEEGLETQVKACIRMYGRSETLATALAVACGQGMEVSADSRLSKMNDPDVLEFARRVFIEYGGRPTVNENAVTESSTLAIDAVIPSPRHAGIALYMSRLLRSIWKSLIAKKDQSPTTGVTISPTVDIPSLLSIQRDLSALQDFFSTNRTFIEGLSGPEALSRAATKQEEVALQAEHRALHSLVQLITHTIEGISFVVLLFDDKVEDIIALLSETARNEFLTLTFEQLFATSKGQETAKELVKAIVNRNIAKGSNVETVAEALRRRCGTFCSSEDVVIFKGQELLKRATEAGANSELGRNLLNESLALFQQVSESLPMDYLQSNVDQYIHNQFFAGAILLALGVAADSDKANHALSWIMDGRPANDPRQSTYETRKKCYELVYKILLAVDELAEQKNPYDEAEAVVMSRRKVEAYDVISNSRDEVFLTTLYDWYLERGLSERLLETKTPFVATYLERKSAEDIFHADLLCKYYAQSNRFYDAASVQLQLAKGPFKLTLNRRIEYLGQARANASVHSPEVGRSSRQRLQHEVEELLDVAHVQDDLLMRLKDDDRIDAQRKAEVVEQINGNIMELSAMFNSFADPGNYYDICLQIMHLANHRNASDITTTWQSLIQAVHEETVRNKTIKPYEAVIEKVRNLASRLRMSDVAFPVQTILPMLERYRLERQKDVGSPTWVVDLFRELRVEHELIYTVLESLFYDDEVPFHGSNRKYIANDLAYLILRWFNETIRVGGDGAFGSDVIANRISEMLLLLQQARLDKNVTQACQDLRVRIEQSLR